MQAFKIGQVVFDMENKEHVKLTNGTDAGGVFVPSEAIAIRFISFDQDSKPVLAYTYRKVNPAYLSANVKRHEGTDDIDVLLMGETVNPCFNFIGRV